MITEIQELMDQYIAWLRDKTTLREVNNRWVEITTPHLDRNNDYLQLYTRLENDGSLTLTDDGHIIDDLRLSGCEMTTKKRQDLLRMTLNGFGVKMEKGALLLKATRANFPMQKHNLVQAMLAVNDMFYLSQTTIASLFLEDVTLWLERNDIRNTPRVKFTGQTGYDHLFDFVIPKSRAKPERILQTMTKPTRDRAQSLVFAWMDTKDVRPPESQAYAILNDSDQRPSPTVIDALRAYSIEPILWSERESVRDDLAA